QGGEVAIFRAVLLDDQTSLDAALLGEQRGVDVGDVLTDDVRENPLERSQPVDADVIVGQFATDLDVQAGESRRSQAAEDLTELLDERDARTHERVDDAAGDVDSIRNEIALKGELDGAGDRNPSLLLRLVGGCAEVRCDDDVRQVQQGVCGAALRRRLRGEHVETSAGDLTGDESL